MTSLPRRVLFGAAYYHEYQPYDRLKDDLDLMAEARFTVIRVGESVWSTWEPENGRFDLDWLQPVLDGAHERGISVLLGTPTYAVPPWLARQYPEIAGERSTGRRIPWGARQEADITHPAFRFHAERVTRRILERCAGHPAVIGFQVDNEPGNELLYNHGVFQRFVDHLRAKYGDVETLNRAWGLVYWSHRLSTWADLWTPDGNAQPQYDIAWREFQARQVNEYIAWQAGLVREYARPEQFVTTCIDYGRPAVDDDTMTDALDVSSGNAYYETQDALALPGTDVPVRHPWKAMGPRGLYLRADRMYSSRQEPFLVTETNAGGVGGPFENRPPYDGQLRQAAWAFVSRGARMIEYWHWHTLHFGGETYWGGVLPHSGRPGRIHAEVARIGAEFEAAGDLVVDLVPDADVTLVYSRPTKWLMEKYPPLAHPDGSPDPDAYDALFDPFHRGAFDARLQARIVHARELADTPPKQAARQHRVLVASGLYLTDDRTLDWLGAYAEAGGHLVLGPRTGYGDEEGRARTDVMPARLAAAAGVHYAEFGNLNEPVPVIATDPALATGGPAWATRWADSLVADDATVLARYDHPHLGKWPAVTTRRVGEGSITYVGTVPDEQLAQALLAWACPSSPDDWADLPASVTRTSATAADGRRVHFLHNWSWTPEPVRLPRAFRDVVNGRPCAEAESLELGPWDVRVLVESGEDTPRTEPRRQPAVVGQSESLPYGPRC
ncbi:beta-galactosidase [Streptomyces turgidiscabies]|uniref:beta-galactosidase n=1 Tax=Streptomyces turgidiscabies TaxID=85558 RepID=UPI0038F7989B